MSSHYTENANRWRKNSVANYKQRRNFLCRRNDCRWKWKTYVTDNMRQEYEKQRLINIVIVICFSQQECVTNNETIGNAWRREKTDNWCACVANLGLFGNTIGNACITNSSPNWQCMSRQFSPQLAMPASPIASFSRQNFLQNLPKLATGASPIVQFLQKFFIPDTIIWPLNSSVII